LGSDRIAAVPSGTVQSEFSLLLFLFVIVVFVVVVVVAAAAVVVVVVTVLQPNKTFHLHLAMKRVRL
jgi:hypothetical protein